MTYITKKTQKNLYVSKNNCNFAIKIVKLTNLWTTTSICEQ